MQNITRRFLLPALTMLLTVGLTLPAATAQEGRTNFDVTNTNFTPGNIAADTGKSTVLIEWIYTIPTTGFQAFGALTTSTTLQWDPPSCDSDGMIITGSRSQTIVIQEGTEEPQTVVEGDSTFYITATQDAPGETPISCSFTGKVLAVQGQQVPESNPSTGDNTIVVDFLGLLSASVPTTIKKAGPQKVLSYDITLTNLGNSLTNVDFQIVGEAGGGWKPLKPGQIVLQSTQQGGTDTSGEVAFTISTPFKNGWNNKEDTFQLDIVPKSTKDASKEGTTITINVLARVRGVYVPTLEPIVMLAAVIGSALTVRLLNKEE